MDAIAHSPTCDQTAPISKKRILGPGQLLPTETRFPYTWELTDPLFVL